MSQRELFPRQLSANAPPEPPGFAYRTEAFGAAEELEWLRALRALPFKPFEFHG